MAPRPQQTNIEEHDYDKGEIRPNNRDNAPDDWVRKVKSAWQVSTTYYENNYQKQMVKNQHLFDNRHPPGSIYHTEAYKFRSKIFRPKIRSAGRKQEAAGNQAFFSTIDPITISAEDDTNPKEMMAAELTAGALKHHLNHTMDWFKTCIGGIQDAYKTGLVISYNYWKKTVARYKVQKAVYDNAGNVLKDENGDIVYKEEIEEEILEDRPCVELIPVNRVRFHAAAHWIDPVNSSPFFFILWPMCICDIKKRMHEDTPKNERWIKYDDQQIINAKLRQNFDATEQARRQNKQDPFEIQTPGISDYDISIVLQCFMIGDDGRRYTFWMLGNSLRLSEPTLLKKEFPHGKNPITMGYLVLESHKNWPMAPPQLAQTMQKETNDLANSRLDNIKLVLNKRYLVKRGSQTDTRSLLLNAAGSVTMTGDPERDVREMEFNDITGSAFAEQDRINVDMDELLGNFSQSSVQTNRKLNETVGGMQMMHGSAGQISDYSLATFVNSWLEPTLRQVVSLIQYYETDQDRLNTVAKKNDFQSKFDVDDVNEEMLHGKVNLTVDVGVGASNPIFKVEQFINAIKQFAEILALGLPGLQMQEIAKELFGYIGYKDASRFFNLDEEGNVNPQMQELQQELQRLQQTIDSKQIENNGKQAIEKMKLAQQTASERKQREHDWNINQADNRHDLRIAMLKYKGDQEKIAVEKDKIKSQEKISKENKASNKDGNKSNN